MTHSIPIRTCIGCRRKGPKSSFIRFTYTLGDGIRLDDRQRLPGRGAYLCRDTKCLEKAWKKGAFTRALRISPSQRKELGAEAFNRLKEEMEILVSRDKDRSKEGEINEQT